MNLPGLIEVKSAWRNLGQGYPVSHLNCPIVRTLFDILAPLQPMGVYRIPIYQLKGDKGEPSPEQVYDLAVKLSTGALQTIKGLFPVNELQ